MAKKANMHYQVIQNSYINLRKDAIYIWLGCKRKVTCSMGAIRAFLFPAFVYSSEYMGCMLMSTAIKSSFATISAFQYCKYSSMEYLHTVNVWLPVWQSHIYCASLCLFMPHFPQSIPSCQPLALLPHQNKQFLWQQMWNSSAANAVSSASAVGSLLDQYHSIWIHKGRSLLIFPFT